MKREASAALARLGGKVLILGSALLMIRSSNGAQEPTSLFAFQHQVDVHESGDSEDKAKTARTYKHTWSRFNTAEIMVLDVFGVFMMRSRCLKDMFVVASCFVSGENYCEGQHSRSCACSGAGMPLSCSLLKCYTAVLNTYSL